MIITRKAIPRPYLVLRGLGASLALPLLDGMVPAAAAMRNTAAAPIKRYGVVYVPNGMMMNHWTPRTEGVGFAFPTVMKPLEPFPLLRSGPCRACTASTARGRTHARRLAS